MIAGERINLTTTVSLEEVARTFSLLCDGSVYARREGIREGYISVFGGIRVGVCGTARYDDGHLVGISDVSALVFRIPTGVFSGIGPLYEAWDRCKHGMLIYSPPGIGKTTALRVLSSVIGSGRCGEQVVVVDERCEFVAEDYKSASVDILRGYKRADGMEIALRTLSPTVIVVDEIGRKKEAEAMLESLNSGVRILASAHAQSYLEIRKRWAMKPFIESGVFDVFVGIVMKNGYRTLEVEVNKN
jgi:stage III sporulation protein AA